MRFVSVAGVDFINYLGCIGMFAAAAYVVEKSALSAIKIIHSYQVDENDTTGKSLKTAAKSLALVAYVASALLANLGFSICLAFAGVYFVNAAITVGSFETIYYMTTFALTIITAPYRYKAYEDAVATPAEMKVKKEETKTQQIQLLDLS